MTNRFPVVSLILFVCCFAAALYLSISSTKLPELRKKMYTDVPSQLERVYAPVAGLDKFFADAQWVSLVQDMADFNVTDKSKGGKKISEEEEKKVRLERAKTFFARFDRLSDIDPNNEKYYEIGALFLSNDLPQEAMTLLQKGDKMVKNPSYKYPFYQYHIINNIISMNDDKKKEENRPQMIELLGQAMGRSGAPDHIQNKWLRLQAEAKGYDDDSVGKLRLWRDYYLSKIKALSVGAGERSADGKISENQTAAAGRKTSSPDIYASSDRYNGLLSQIMSMAQNMAVENFNKRQKAKGDELAKLQKEHKEIHDIFFSVAPAGHYSDVSLHPYAAGDLFDVHTGTPVKPYGVDPDMLQEGKIVIYKGGYSQVTGKPRNEDYSKFKHEEFLKKVNVAK